MLATARIALRPIRMAVLIDRLDKATLRSAIRCCTVFWGGCFFPIVPMLNSYGLEWFKKRKKGKDASRRLLDQFVAIYDPDYFILVGDTPPPDWIPSHQCLKFEDITSRLRASSLGVHGVTIFEVLDHVIDTEFTFTRSDDLRILPVLPEGTCALFLASFFGDLDDDLMERVIDALPASSALQPVNCGIEDYSRLGAASKLSLRRLTGYDTACYLEGDLGILPSVFILDAESPLDTLDYWNLRALGHRVLAVPLQCFHDNAISDAARAFVRATIQNRDRRELDLPTCTILIGRSLTETQHQQAKEWCRETIRRDDGPPVRVSLAEYPTFWATGTPGPLSHLESRRDRLEITADDRTISFRGIAPRFELHAPALHPKYANDVEFSVYGHKDLIAEVIPGGVQNLLRAFGVISWSNWRISRSGVVYLANDRTPNIRVDLPLANEVFSAWMESKGWSIEPSSAGRIALQMYKQIPSYTLGILAMPGIVDLLCKISKKPPISVDALMNEAGQVAARQRLPDKAQWILNRLNNVNALTLGASIECSVCGQTNWYDVRSLAYKLTCSACLSEFDFPQYDPKNQVDWTYRAKGTFSLPSSAYGSYTVLLTYRFFSDVVRGSTTPMLGFIAAKGSNKLECDLGMVFQDDYARETSRHLIVCECKTHNPFLPKDVKRLKRFWPDFFEAVLVFATLNESLSAQEKRLIQGVVRSRRRTRSSRTSFAPVCVLCASELLSEYYHGLEVVLTRRGDGTPSTMGPAYSLTEICLATQEKYLR